MKRREFIALLGGAAAAYPLYSRAQQGVRLRRVGILWRGQATEGVVKALEGTLLEELKKLGWIEGGNVQFYLRYSADDPDRIRAHADELVHLEPDVIAASSSPVAYAVLQRTQTIPVVFINVADPVAGGLLKDIARPERNATGITNYYQSIGGKLLELIKEASPRTTHAALIFSAENVNAQFFDAIDDSAEALGMKTARVPYRNAAELQGAIETLWEANSALVMVPPPPAPIHGELINRLAIKYRLPTIYSSKYYVAQGGMMSYGPPIGESYRMAAGYIDRILRGANIKELPVIFPTKLELAINVKTAKAIGLTIPRITLTRADELIE